MSLLVGKPAPDFKGTAVIGGNADELFPENAFKEYSLSDFKGKWLILFFYPLDFTFVCPTEIEGFGKIYDKLQSLNCEVLACSTDSKHSHLAWRKDRPTLKNLPFPMLSDFNKDISRNYEILIEEEGFTLRGTYIINPDGKLVYSVIHPDEVGRSTDEILRVLEALQTGKLTACDWSAGDNTLN